MISCSYWINGVYIMTHSFKAPVQETVVAVHRPFRFQCCRIYPDDSRVLFEAVG